MTSATRVSGPAPLSVVFDPIGGSSGVVQPAGGAPNYATFAYSWDFDDPTSGTWAHTGKSKNASHAWIGAHVFEAPGAYRVLLTVTDASGVASSYHQDITVTDPDVVFAARTFYVAAPGSGGSDGNPGTQAQPFATAAAGIAAAFGTSGAARLRFNRGDTFTPSGLTISGTGPRLIDAYGTGARPQMAFTSGGFTASGSDVRICDLDCSASGSGTGVGLGTQTTVCGCTLSGFSFGLGSSGVDQVCAYECEVLNSADYGCYLFGATDLTGGRHMAILGTRFNIAGQHLIRTYMSLSVIEGCHFDTPTPGFDHFKLVGRPAPDPSHHVCVVGNRVDVGSISDALNMGPENITSTDQVATDYLVEGNYFYSRLAGNSCIRVMGPRITLRNNVFDLTDNRRAVRVEPWGGGPVPNNIVIEHNTAVSAGTILYVLDADSSDLTVLRNNLFYCPGGTVETPIGDVSSSGNVTAVTDLFQTLAGIVGGEWALTTSGTNAAVDVGVASLNRFDFAGRPRPFGLGLDVGAFERLQLVTGAADWVCQHRHVTNPVATVDISVDAFAAVDPTTEGGVDRVEFYVSENGAAPVTHTVLARSMRYPNHSEAASPLPGVARGTMAPFYGYGITITPGDYDGGTITVTASSFSSVETETAVARSIVIHNDTDATDRRPSTRTIYVDPVFGSDGDSGLTLADAVRSINVGISLARANPAGASSADRDCGGATVVLMPGEHVWSSAGISFPWHTSGKWWLTITSQPGATITRTDLGAGGQIAMPGNGGGTACRIRMISPHFVGLGGLVANTSTVECEVWLDGPLHRSSYWGVSTPYSVRFLEDAGKAMEMLTPGPLARVFATCGTFEGVAHGPSEFYSADDCVIRNWVGIGVESVQFGSNGGGHVRNCMFDGQRDYRDCKGRVRGLVTGSTVTVPAAGQMRIDATGPLVFGSAGNGAPMSLATLTEIAGSTFFRVKCSNMPTGGNGTFQVLSAGTNVGGWGFVVLANPSATPGTCGASALVETSYADGNPELAIPYGISFAGGDSGQIVGAIYRDIAMRDVDNQHSFYTASTTLNRCVFHNNRDGCNYEKQANWAGGSKLDCIITNNTIGGFWAWSVGSNVAGMNFANNVSENGSSMPTTDAYIDSNHTRFGPSTGSNASTGSWFAAASDTVAPWHYDPAGGNIGTASAVVDLPDTWKWNPALGHSRGCLRNVGRFDWSTNPVASAASPAVGTLGVPAAVALPGVRATAAGGVAISSFAAPTATASTDATPPIVVTVADVAIAMTARAPASAGAAAGALATAAGSTVGLFAVSTLDDGGGTIAKPNALAIATLTVDLSIGTPEGQADVAIVGEATTTTVGAFAAPVATASTLGGTQVAAPSPAFRFSAPLATALVGVVVPEPETPQQSGQSSQRERRRRPWRSQPINVRPTRTVAP